MNDRYGRDDRYRNDRWRVERYRDEPYHEDRYGEERWLRSPEHDFETSQPYRQPPDERYGRGLRANYGNPYHRLPDFREQGYAPSPYLPPEPRGGFSGRGPKGYVRTDERIREDVCDRLSWNDEVDATDITVRVEGGEVTLEGSVETRHMKRLADDIADEVPGVRDVHNTIRVTKPILTELKEKITGEARTEHYANTGTRTTGSTSASGRNGIT
jgi:hypothetical protein